MVTRRESLTVLASLAGMATSSSWLSAAGASQDDVSVRTFAIDELVSQRASSGRPYLPFLDLPTLRCGLYVLAAGAEDGQSPHDTDEVYYTLSGKAKITVEGEVEPVEAGSVIYVKAHAEHRFVDIEEELRLLVFFD
jgi:quercetin dioxygenase-like cupin family protein